MAVNELIRQAVQCARERPRFAYIAPYFKQAKSIAWDYCHKYAGVIPGVHFNESELRVDLPNHARLALLGADNADAIRGVYLDGVVLDEYAYMAPRVWGEVVRPALADREGFAIFLGTPLGRNHLYRLYEQACLRSDTLSALYRASETGVLSDAELAQARQDMTPEQYAQEFECSFEAAILGAYYARELEAARAAGRIRAFDWDKTVGVETYWDLGWDDATAIIFAQRLGREIRVLDYLEATGKDLSWYAKQVRERPYVYDRHHLPHDAEVHELGSGKSRVEWLTELGLRPLSVLGKNDPADGIEQARLLFPRVWINEPQCRVLLEALASYRAEWDDKRRVFKETPLHDWASHGADAFRLMAIATKRPAAGRELAPRTPTTLDFDPRNYARERVVERRTVMDFDPRTS